MWLSKIYIQIHTLLCARVSLLSCNLLNVIQVNGAEATNNNCSNYEIGYGTYSHNAKPDDLFYYIQDDGSEYEIPNSLYYVNQYQTRQSKMGIKAARNLYGSDCLEGLVGTINIDDTNYGPFGYDEQLLYNIEEDKIEACAYAGRAAKKNELFQKRVRVV